MSPEKSNTQNQVVLMLLFSLFMGASLAFFFAASTAIFLDHFSSSAIPASYIFSGIVVYLTWLALSKIEKKLSFTQKVTTKMGVMLGSFSIISLGVWFTNNEWLAFILFSWIRVFVFLVFVSFWGIAGKLFNLKQGKRIFGFIGSGEVISLMIGYFSIPLLLKFFEAKDLLIFSVLALLCCFIITLKINKKYKDLLNSEEKGLDTLSPKSKTKNKSIIFKQPFLKQIALMALLPIFGYMFMDFMFLDQAKKVFLVSTDPKNDMAKFLGYFLGAVAFVELCIKLFISGRALTKFGIKWGLLSLPLSLFISITGGLVALLMGSKGFFFFAFLMVARLADKAMRGGFYDPSFQLLFQPMPSSERFKFQSTIDGIPKALGTILTGIAILLLSSLQSSPMVFYSIFYLAIVGYWIYGVFSTHKYYKKALFAVLKKAEKSNVQEFNYPIDFLKQKFRSADEYTRQASKWMLKQIVPHFFSNQEALALKKIHPEEKWNGELQTNEITDKKNKPVLILPRTTEVEIPGTSLDEINNSNFDFLTKGHELKEKLVAQGDEWIGRLQREFSKAGVLNVQKRIIETYAKIGTKEAENSLFNLLNFSNRDIQIAAARALRYMDYKVPNDEGKKQILTNKVESICQSISYLNACILDLTNQPDCETILNFLKEEKIESFHFLFDSLGLIHHSASIELIRKNILNSSSETNIYALELIDNYFEGETKDILLILFDTASIQNKIKRLNKIFPQEHLSKTDRLKDIINRNYSSINIGIKSMAIKLLIYSDNEKVPDEIFACLFHTNPIIYEETSVELNKLSSENFKNYYPLLPITHQKRLSYLNENKKTEEKKVSEIIQLLKEIPVFKNLNNNLLNIIALTFQENAKIKSIQKNKVRLIDGKSEKLQVLRVKYKMPLQVLELDEEEFLALNFPAKDVLELNANEFYNLVADDTELTLSFFDLVKKMYLGKTENTKPSKETKLAKAI